MLMGLLLISQLAAAAVRDAAVLAPDCVSFTTPRLPAGRSFREPIGGGLEARLLPQTSGTWSISVGPVGTTDDYLDVVSPPFQTAPHLLIGAGYNLTAVQSVQLSPRYLRFVQTADQYTAAARLAEKAQRDSSGAITVADIRRQATGFLELWITGFGMAPSKHTLAWVSVRGRACRQR